MQNKYVAVFAALFFEHIDTCDSKVNRALTHTGNDIAWALKAAGKEDMLDDVLKGLKEEGYGLKDDKE